MDSFFNFLFKSMFLLLFSNRCLHFYYTRFSNFYSSFTEVTACSFKDHFPSHIFPWVFRVVIFPCCCLLFIAKFRVFFYFLTPKVNMDLPWLALFKTNKQTKQTLVVLIFLWALINLPWRIQLCWCVLL